ncbi:MFS transporter [Marinitenerispora sediminis]|uniref:MFS transporter n=1 Tax=Marinitenerispora sediminis TaxID=1931232 RepID=A0A368TBX0_9ACTN|nr:MFS transporter [Marinitenerispora sediminis]RCV58192.1 MFS transporter [Marinitenerispora sediminis]RCV61473.1 MFS transporter [Marinitenerispora sediminis]RCV62555.1 MFS transporter [Marinitenerispora sediminis]
MTAAGVATFAQLYSVQAVLPGLAATFDASAARVALTVSMATGGLAAFVLFWSGIADRFGRVRVMTVALAVSTILGAVAPFAPDLATLVALRAVQGAALGGLPAVAMAYLAEEIHPEHLGRAAGVYIAGNTVGGMSGRLVAGAVADLGGWRWGVGADAVLGAVTLVVFLAAIPRARGFRPRARAHGGPGLARRVAASVTDPGLLALYCQGLFLMGAFVTVYNFLGFRLLDAPFGLPQAAVALLFAAYLAGTVSSAVAGRMIERTGRHTVLLASVAVMAAGALALLPGALAAVVPGLVVLTFGFFAAHTTASAWVGHRAAPEVRAQASALYTLGYYVGSSLFGWLGGVCYDRLGWNGVVAYVLALCAASALAGVGLRLRLAGRAAAPGIAG